MDLYFWDSENFETDFEDSNQILGGPKFFWRNLKDFENFEFFELFFLFFGKIFFWFFWFFSYNAFLIYNPPFNHFRAERSEARLAARSRRATRNQSWAVESDESRRGASVCSAIFSDNAQLSFAHSLSHTHTGEHSWAGYFLSRTVYRALPAAVRAEIAKLFGSELRGMAFCCKIRASTQKALPNKRRAFERADILAFQGKVKDCRWHLLCALAFLSLPQK